MRENRVQQIAFDGQTLALGCAEFRIERRRLGRAGDAAVILVEVLRQETGARRAVRRTERNVSGVQVRLKENHPWFFSLTVANATTGNSAEAAWQRIDLRAVVQHPTFVVVEQSAVVVIHIQPRSQRQLPQGGQSTDLPALRFVALQCGKKQ